ncbi:MAG: C40 family peptidase [Anaerolineales bacterium]|nr:C40 family peptidase [Anaerolineales bacterium]
MAEPQKHSRTPFALHKPPAHTLPGGLPWWASAFCVIGMLSGCRENASPPPQLSATAVAADPSPRLPAAATPSAEVLPSEAPTAAPAPDLPEFAVRTTKADVWNAPENENSYWDLQTQLILGERVLVLEALGEWSRIAAVEQPSHKDPRGYPGWVRSEFLTPSSPAAERYAVVMTARTHLGSDSADRDGMLVYLDTRLPAEEVLEDRVVVRLPDGGKGWLPRKDVRLTDDLARPVPADGIFALAESMTGTPYVWGGTTSDTLDCAGFPYRLFHAYGILISRDADDQMLEGEYVDRFSVRRGDLIFAAESSGGEVAHEVMYWGDDMVLDVDIHHGVMLRPMPDFFLQYYFWIAARRFLP